MDGVWLGTGGEVTEGFCFLLWCGCWSPAVSGGIVGFERGLKGRPAGLKTFSLVCIGAAMVMVTNEYIMLFISGGAGMPPGWAAQVIRRNRIPGGGDDHGDGSQPGKRADHRRSPVGDGGSGNYDRHGILLRSGGGHGGGLRIFQGFTPC